jgi:ATP-binding cassette subfamily F protein 3
MIKAINLSKSFGKQELFDNSGFHINRGEKIGLTGRNGHGKSTLFRMITGTDHPDSGEIVVPGDYRIGYLKQEVRFSEKTVLEEGCRDLPRWQKDDSWRIEKILSGLGFTSSDLKKDPHELSGGYQIRLNLGKVLGSEPDMLLLDEPTNFLDILSIRWLKDFLKKWEREMILITHDRGFMDSVVTHILGIHRKKIRKITGTTEKLYQQLAKEEEIYEKTRLNDEKKKKEAEIFINRFRAKARLAGLVQSRIKALEKKEHLEKLENIKTLDFSFAYSDFNAKTVMSAGDITFSYERSAPPLIKNLSLTVAKHDRIGVIGKNGRGKTTLLRLLAGGLSPWSGDIHTHSNTSIGYYAQTNTENLNSSLTIEEEIMQAGADRQQARNIAGAMMFEGDEALKKIAVLSGGEKCRVLLGKLLASPSNLLLLDEPTNHLDMESCDAFLAAIDDFPGAVIIVTHNEMFLNSLAERFVVFRDKETMVFEGAYMDFLNRIGWESERSNQPGQSQQVREKKGNINKKDLRKQRADILSRKSKELKPVEEKMAGVENDIEENESTLEDLNKKMIELSSSGGGEKISELSKEIHEIRNSIDLLYTELEELTDRQEDLEKKFSGELECLEENQR